MSEKCKFFVQIIQSIFTLSACCIYTVSRFINLVSLKSVKKNDSSTKTRTSYANRRAMNFCGEDVATQKMRLTDEGRFCRVVVEFSIDQGLRPCAYAEFHLPTYQSTYLFCLSAEGLIVLCKQQSNSFPNNSIGCNRNSVIEKKKKTQT